MSTAPAIAESSRENEAALPEGWVCVRLGGIVSPSKEKVDPRGHPDEPYLSLEHVEPGTTRIVGRGKGSDVTSAKSVFREGDVLYGKLRPYLNKVCVPHFGGVCSTDFLIFPGRPELDGRYLKWFLARRETVEFANHHMSGVQLPRVSFEKLAELEFSFPPPPEQARIAAIVDEVADKVQAVRERLTRVPQILKRFRQSVLAAACSGRLTEDWRGPFLNVTPAARLIHRDAASKLPDAGGHLDGLQLPASWMSARVDTLVSIQNGRAFPSKQYRGQGIRLLRPGNLHTSGRVEWTEENTVALSERWAKDFPEFILDAGELLMNLTAQSLRDEFLGRVCVKDDEEPALLNQRIARLRPIGDFDVRPYLLLYFKSRFFRTFVNGLDTGSLIRHMHSKDVGRHVLPLPPPEEQLEIVRRVWALLSLADTVEQRVEVTGDRTARLTQATLAKAFRGELVTTEADLARREGREFKPASAWLEELKIGGHFAGSHRKIALRS